jgi:hypothetical protein
MTGRRDSCREREDEGGSVERAEEVGGGGKGEAAARELERG